MLVSNLNKAQLWGQFGLSAATPQQKQLPIMLSEAGVSDRQEMQDFEGQQSLDLRSEPLEPMKKISSRPPKANDVFNRLTADARRKVERNRREEVETIPKKAIPSQKRTPRNCEKGKIEDKLIQYGKYQEMKRLHDRALVQAQDMANLTSSPTISPLSKQIASTPGSYTTALKNIMLTLLTLQQTQRVRIEMLLSQQYLPIVSKELLDIERKESEAARKTRLIKAENDRKQKEHQLQREKLQGFLRAPPPNFVQDSHKELERVQERVYTAPAIKFETQEPQRFVPYIQSHPELVENNIEERNSFPESLSSLQEMRIDPYKKNVITLPESNNFSSKESLFQPRTSTNQEEERIKKRKMIEDMIKNRQRQCKNPSESSQPRYYESIEERIRQKALPTQKVEKIPNIPPKVCNDRKMISQRLDLHYANQKEQAKSLKAQKPPPFSSKLLYPQVLQTKPPAPRQPKFEKSKQGVEAHNHSFEAAKKPLQSRKPQLNVAMRNELWLKKKNEKLEQRKGEISNKQFFGCSFTPTLESKQHQFHHTSGMSSSSIYKGLSPGNISSTDLNTIKFSNSYSKIKEIKSRSRSQDYCNLDNIPSSLAKNLSNNFRNAMLRSHNAS